MGVTGHESKATSVQEVIEPRRYFRSAFGRLHRSSQHQCRENCLCSAARLSSKPKRVLEGGAEQPAGIAPDDTIPQVILPNKTCIERVSRWLHSGCTDASLTELRLIRPISPPQIVQAIMALVRADDRSAGRGSTLDSELPGIEPRSDAAEVSGPRSIDARLLALFSARASSLQLE
jgi:hypothetical protein